MSDKPECFETDLYGAERDCTGCDSTYFACMECARYLALSEIAEDDNEEVDA